jgi:hypothetical protein
MPAKAGIHAVLQTHVQPVLKSPALTKSRLEQKNSKKNHFLNIIFAYSSSHMRGKQPSPPNLDNGIASHLAYIRASFTGAQPRRFYRG